MLNKPSGAGTHTLRGNQVNITAADALPPGVARLSGTKEVCRIKVPCHSCGMISTTCAVSVMKRDRKYKHIFMFLEIHAIKFNTSRPGQNDRHRVDCILYGLSSREMCFIWLKGPIDLIPNSLYLNQWWSRQLTHICTTGPCLAILRHDAVARILANGSAAFIESCAAIGWNSCDSVRSL